MTKLLSRRAFCLSALALTAASRAAIPITFSKGHCLVPVLLNKRPSQMILDTGAERSLLTIQAVSRLHLPLDLYVQTTIQGAGGRLETHANADAMTATLGGTRLTQRPSQNGLSLSVTRQSLFAADGLLGADILHHFTLDIDFPNRTLRLRPPGAIPCATALERLFPNQLLAPITLNGIPLTAVIDTGAATSLLNARGLYRMGLNSSHDPEFTLGTLTGPLNARLHRFQTLRLSTFNLQNIEILTAPIPEPAFDLTLGLDILAGHRVILSYDPPSISILG